MSLKACNRVLPQVVNCLIRNNTFLFHPVIVKFSSSVVPLNLNNLVVNRQFSSTHTIAKKSENNIKPIYYGVLTPQIRAVKMFSLSSSIVGIIAQPFLYKEIAATGNVPIIIAAYSFIGFFTIVTPVLLHLITKKYITHLEYKPDTDSYVAKTVNFFCMTKELQIVLNLNLRMFMFPEVPGMFTTFCAKGKALFLDPRLFDNPEHYAKIMGYDKPIDFKLNEKTTPNANKQA
ncbi:hypothetical protein NQ314_016119 [Rhamnusium bicolor]|uniref:Transmembrane protein 70 homolog, mitochondrial n=1 Tax=Rhamnusium bicolor TaxID=1586634 RepID=A0AAV8WXT8_9CUCU|nr:hypothetical protein NQ314_016119 [Rhamnusium bicolor]